MSMWTEFKAIFNSDIDDLVRENQRLRLDNELLRSDNESCKETKERSEEYMQECDRAFHTWLKCHYSANFKSWKNELTLRFLQNTDSTAERMIDLEERLEYNCNKVRDLEQKLDEAQAQIDNLNDFIKTLPDGFKYAYDLFMKNKHE